MNANNTSNITYTDLQGFSGTSTDLSGAITTTTGRRNSILTDQSDMNTDNFFESTDNIVIDSIKGVVKWASKMEETLKNYA